jgi:hypothetical protein
MVDAGKSLDDVMAADLTKPYDASTKGDDATSIKRFVSELYYEAKGLPAVVDGRRAMPRPPQAR